MESAARGHALTHEQQSQQSDGSRITGLTRVPVKQISRAHFFTAAFRFSGAPVAQTVINTHAHYLSSSNGIGV